MMKLVLALLVLAQTNAFVFERPKENQAKGYFNYVELERGDSDKIGEASIRDLEASYGSKRLHFTNNQGVYDFSLFASESEFKLESHSIKSTLGIDKEILNVFKLLDYLKAENIDFFFNADESRGEGESFLALYNDDQLSLHNYKFFCDRTKIEDAANLGESLQKACFNHFELTPSNGSFGVHILDRFKGHVRAILKMVGKKLTVAEKKVTSLLETLSLEILKSQYLFNIDQSEFSCEKEAGIKRLTQKSFTLPCLQSISFKAKKLQGINQKDPISLELNDINFSTKETIFFGSAMAGKIDSHNSMIESLHTSFSCNKIKDFDDLDLESYVSSCMDGLHLSPGIGEEHAALSLKNESEHGESVLSMKLKEALLYPTEIVAEAEEIEHNLNDKIIVKLDKASLKCQKEAGMIEANVDKLIDGCKKNFNIDASEVVINNNQTDKDPIVFKFDPETFSGSDTELQIRTPSFKVVDSKNISLLKDIYIECKRSASSDIFKKEDILTDCANQMYMRAEFMYVSEKSLPKDPKKLKLDGGNDFKESELSPTVKEISFTVKDNLFDLTMKPKFLGRHRKVGLAGIVEYDVENKQIILKTRQARLPLGIRSKKIFLWAAKKFLAGEQVKIEGKNILIKI